MKKLLSIILIGLNLAGMAQSHRISVDGGINSTLTWDGNPPFGEWSPYDAKLGYSINLSYSYIFENNIILSFRNSLAFYNFHSNDFWASIDEEGEPVYVETKVELSYYQASLGGGYLFEIGERYSLGVHLGASMLYNYKQVSYIIGQSEPENETKWPWHKRNRYYGVFLSLNNNYQLYSARKHSMYITGVIRATQVFNYGWSDSGLNRLLPEFTLGVAVAFNTSNGSRF
ncbi:hypothetical protein [Owenweeksia hongkongensis]|uniref:hypothetical protein n=1 Tax=Owenweeksia hongkongensis TaxID=253245 RepID=UPI003A8F4422